MRFLLDESADLPLAPYLRQLGHDVTTVVHDYIPSIADRQVLAIAKREQRILITNDKDFGELIYRQALPHSGVVLFRMKQEDIPFKITRLNDILAEHSDELETYTTYIVVTDKRIRASQ